MPPVAPVMSNVAGCCWERGEDCRGVDCPMVGSWLTVSFWPYEISEPHFCRDCVIGRNHAAILTVQQPGCSQCLNVFMNTFVVAAKTFGKRPHRARRLLMDRTQQLESFRRQSVQHCRQIQKSEMSFPYFLATLESMPCAHEALTHVVERSNMYLDALAHCLPRRPRTSAKKSEINCSTDVKAYRSCLTFNVSVTDITLHIAESRLQPHRRRDGGGLSAQDAGS